MTVLHEAIDFRCGHHALMATEKYGKDGGMSITKYAKDTGRKNERELSVRLRGAAAVRSGRVEGLISGPCQPV